ncbi:MAG TPA: hypothetical protein VFT50_05185 [Baekduia sp.]|nr:hypothetical protein [Baekduia sp.]
MPTVDVPAAGRFVAAHARLVDRRRFAHLFEGAPAALVRAAVAAYRNPDGGFGALEPDIRSASSQPLPTLYAFDLLHEARIDDPALATGALDWLATVTNDDGGLAFVLPSVDEADRSPWLAPPDGSPSSLHITSALAGAAHRLGLEHAWLDRATAYVWDRLPHLDMVAAYEVRYVVDFLDSVPDRDRAAAALEALRPHVPPAGLPVRGGAEGETLSPLVVAPWPEHAGRGLFADAAIEAALDELAAGQQPDGGWTFDWPPLNDAVLWEWRGAVSVTACRTLRAYGRL